jgi:hypothetical protein
MADQYTGWAEQFFDPGRASKEPEPRTGCGSVTRGSWSSGWCSSTRPAPPTASLGRRLAGERATGPV